MKIRLPQSIGKSIGKVSVKYRQKYRRYFFGKVSVSVSAILFRASIGIDIGDTFKKYR